MELCYIQISPAISGLWFKKGKRNNSGLCGKHVGTFPHLANIIQKTRVLPGTAAVVDGERAGQIVRAQADWEAWTDKVELFGLSLLPAGVAHQVHGVVHRRHPVLPRHQAGDQAGDQTHHEREREQSGPHGGGEVVQSQHRGLTGVLYLYLLISCGGSQTQMEQIFLSTAPLHPIQT